VGYYQDGKLLYAAKVRNGFVPHTRREVAGKLKGLEIDACPFANLPEKKRTQWALTREEMKNCVWLKPQLVAQIEFTDFNIAPSQQVPVIVRADGAPDAKGMQWGLVPWWAKDQTIGNRMINAR